MNKDDLKALHLECMNHEINLQKCPCMSSDCTLKGICCACLEYHHSYSQNQLPFCARGQVDDHSHMDEKEDIELVRERIANSRVECVYVSRKKEKCSCSNKECLLNGTCCSCIERHVQCKIKPLPHCIRP